MKNRKHVATRMASTMPTMNWVDMPVEGGGVNTHVAFLLINV